jgi:hypothetical protein
MAALKPDQLETEAGGAIPEPGRYETDTSCSAVTFRTRHLFGLAPVRTAIVQRARQHAYRPQ